jgi:hypothetical protein
LPRLAQRQGRTAGFQLCNDILRCGQLIGHSDYLTVMRGRCISCVVMRVLCFAAGSGGLGTAAGKLASLPCIVSGLLDGKTLGIHTRLRQSGAQTCDLGFELLSRWNGQNSPTYS